MLTINNLPNKEQHLKTYQTQVADCPVFIYHDLIGNKFQVSVVLTVGDLVGECVDFFYDTVEEVESLINSVGFLTKVNEKYYQNF